MVEQEDSGRGGIGIGVRVGLGSHSLLTILLIITIIVSSLLVFSFNPTDNPAPISVIHIRMHITLFI